MKYKKRDNNRKTPKKPYSTVVLALLQQVKYYLFRGKNFTCFHSNKKPFHHIYHGSVENHTINTMERRMSRKYQDAYAIKRETGEVMDLVIDKEVSSQNFWKIWLSDILTIMDIISNSKQLDVVL